MDVPLFPTPPTLDDGAASLRDVPGVAPSTRSVSLSFAPYYRHVTSRGQGSSSSCCSRKRHPCRRNRVKPRTNGRKGAGSCRRVTELRVRMTERQGDVVTEDPDDVVCANGTSSSEDPSVQMKETTNHEQSFATRSIGVQTSSGLPYRLRVLPSLTDIVDSETTASPKKFSRLYRHLRFLGRLSLCQFGLTWLLSLWAMAGAAAFYATEGPREREQVLELKDMQKDLAIRLATELRQIRSDEREMEPLWSNKVQQYVAKHEKLLLAAVSSGYGEGGGNGQVWTFPGCVLFAISLLTTLGFGAPVPRTTAGRTVAVVFAAIGIPAHFLLILNVGILLAVRIQMYAIRMKQRTCDGDTSGDSLPVPNWVKVVPFGCIGGYYLLGILCFGAARSRPVAACLLFPLDFTAAGGLATTSGLVRTMYAIYLEGAVTIAAVAVAILRVSAAQGLTNIGLKYGLLTNA